MCPHLTRPEQQLPKSKTSAFSPAVSRTKPQSVNFKQYFSAKWKETDKAEPYFFQKRRLLKLRCETVAARARAPHSCSNCRLHDQILVAILLGLCSGFSLQLQLFRCSSNIIIILIKLPSLTCVYIVANVSAAFTITSAAAPASRLRGDVHNCS